MLRYLFVRVLEREGHRVRSFGDGGTALASLLGNPPDLLISDLHVPVIDGGELVRRLRDDPATRTIPCVLLSGSDPATDAPLGLEAFDARLTKPVDVDRIVATVADCLTRAGIRVGDGAAIQPDPAPGQPRVDRARRPA